ncbi:MAG: hotdog domain-containing protein [Burkholderiaceae bacterium]|nr:hotdog domain-containing protein [Burkholderiaceae bacterium]
MHSITLRFLAAQSAPLQAGRIPGGTVLRWVDEAAGACASAWSQGVCVAAFLGGAHFRRPIRPGDLVEVQARLAYTTDTQMYLAVEVRGGPLQGGPLEDVVHCVAVYTALDASEAPCAVAPFSPESPGDIALAQRVQAHLHAAR